MFPLPTNWLKPVINHRRHSYNLRVLNYNTHEKYIFIYLQLYNIQSHNIQHSISITTWLVSGANITVFTISQNQCLVVCEIITAPFYANIYSAITQWLAFNLPELFRISHLVNIKYSHSLINSWLRQNPSNLKTWEYKHFLVISHEEDSRGVRTKRWMEKKGRKKITITLEKSPQTHVVTVSITNNLRPPLYWSVTLINFCSWCTTHTWEHRTTRTDGDLEGSIIVEPSMMWLCNVAFNHPEKGF